MNFIQAYLGLTGEKRFEIMRKKEMNKEKEAVLILEDDTIFKGKGFGATKKISGEVVFNTSLVGYPESLTDPSYQGQILCATYPLVGNYGVPNYDQVDEWGIPIHFESLGIKVAGLIIHELCDFPSHWTSKKTLNNGYWKKIYRASAILIRDI